MSDFTTMQTRKAKSTSRCALCGEMILKGERYIYISGRVIGLWYAVRYHTTCLAVENKCIAANEAIRGDRSSIAWWIMRNVCDKVCPAGHCEYCENRCTRCPNVLDMLGIETEEEE